jgi:hypothetical protein
MTLSPRSFTSECGSSIALDKWPSAVQAHWVQVVMMLEAGHVPVPEGLVGGVLIVRSAEQSNILERGLSS